MTRRITALTGLLLLLALVTRGAAQGPPPAPAITLKGWTGLDQGLQVGYINGQMDMLERVGMTCSRVVTVREVQETLTAVLVMEPAKHQRLALREALLLIWRSVGCTVPAAPAIPELRCPEPAY